MSFYKTYGNHIVTEIAYLIQYFYKKGVLDGGESGDEWEIRLITEREDLDEKFQMLSEFSNKSINFKIYYNFIQTYFILIKARALQHWFIKIKDGKSIKEAICYLCDEYYRKGLGEGLKLGAIKAKEFHSKGYKSFANIGKNIGNEENFLIQIKSDALRISVEREYLRTKMGAFSEYIASIIRKRRDYYMNIKNGELI